jgi:hypothetical protein
MEIVVLCRGLFSCRHVKRQPLHPDDRELLARRGFLDRARHRRPHGISKPVPVVEAFEW